VGEVTIREILDDTEDQLGLTLVVGEAGLDRVIRVPRIQKPGLALAGYEEQLHSDRLLTLGGTEIDYLSNAGSEQCALGVRTVMESTPACIVVTRGLEPPPQLCMTCRNDDVPLLKSTLVSSEFILQVTRYLQERLSPSTSVHAVLVEVLGVGILLLGESGIGKSEAALDLLVRGHRLIADDVVNIRRAGPSLLYGSGAKAIQHHMEIRGLGIINAQELFGVAAVRESKQIDLVIELTYWDEEAEYDRLGIEDQVYAILGEELPFIQVPIRPGRSIATIIEVAARNQLLKFMGHHSARELTERLSSQTARARKEVE
jgi:HPr kinase/phosphorylase